MRQIPAVIAFIALSAPVFAQGAADPLVSDDRFQIERDGEGFIRLDKKTGAISTCVRSGAELDCRSSADERAALQAEIDRLASELEDLRARTGQAEAQTGLSKDGKQLTLKLPSEEDIKGVTAFLQDLLNRVVSAVRELTAPDKP